MGFICEHYSGNQAGLIVAFRDGSSDGGYYAGDSAADALSHFNLYVENNTIYAKSEGDIALGVVGIQNAEEAAIVRDLIDEIISDYSDEMAVENSALFPIWTVGKEYVAGYRVRYNGVLYRVTQAHTSQEDWTPDVAISLFATILTGEDDTPKEWVQPESTNGYMTGDRVIFDGSIYESLIDNNVWSPAAYPDGWKLIS